MLALHARLANNFRTLEGRGTYCKDEDETGVEDVGFSNRSARSSSRSVGVNVTSLDIGKAVSVARWPVMGASVSIDTENPFTERACGF